MSKVDSITGSAVPVPAGKNGPVNKGIPFGSMPVPEKLQKAFTSQASMESKLLVSREEVKKATASFYSRFKAKYPKAGLADFARQFSKDVPFKRADYKRDATYLALDNMFRYMPEVGGKAESETVKAARIAKQKREIKKRKAQAVSQRTRTERLLVAIANQIGIPHDLFEIAAQRIGFSPSEIEAMYNVKGSLVDVGMGTYQLTVRTTGVSALKAASQRKVKDVAGKLSVPTAAELVIQDKGKPTVKDATEATYLGKGQYQRILKKGDNVKANGHATTSV